MKIVFAEQAWTDHRYWQAQDEKILDRMNTLIRECVRTPFEGRKAGAFTWRFARMVVTPDHASTASFIA